MKKKSIILLIFVCLVLGVTNINAQKCKFKYDKTDPFTGNLQRMTATSLLPSIRTETPNTEITAWVVYLVREGNNYNVDVKISLGGELNTNFKIGDSIKFKFANNEIITCYGKSNSSPKTNVVSNTIETTYNCSFNILTPQNMVTFSTSLLTYVRINISDKVYQKEVKEKNALNLKEDAVCIMK